MQLIQIEVISDGKVFAKTEELAENIKELVNVKFESVKLAVAERSSKVASNFISGMIVALAAICFVVFLV